MELTTTVSCLLKTSIAPRTRTQYECGYSAYVTFLSMTGVLWTNSYMPPLTEESLIHFATHCFKNLHLKCSTIKMYICGILYKYLGSGTNSVFSNASDKLYRLDALYRGIKKKESHSTKPRQPITFGLLRDICHRYTFRRNMCYGVFRLSTLRWIHHITFFRPRMQCMYGRCAFPSRQSDFTAESF